MSSSDGVFPRAVQITQWLKDSVRVKVAWFPPETRSGKINQWQLALVKWGREALVWLGGLVSPENLTKGMHAVGSSCSRALVPPETRAELVKRCRHSCTWLLERVSRPEKIDYLLYLGRRCLVGGAVVCVVYALCRYGGVVRMMVAPGLKCCIMIPRFIFEASPKLYFLVLRRGKPWFNVVVLFGLGFLLYYLLF